MDGVKLIASVWAIALVPVWLFDFAPSMDLPNHVAIASVLYRLLTNAPDVTQFYALNPQPTPYYLAYALLSPCVGWWGFVLGTKVFLTVVGILYAVSTAAFLSALGASTFAAVGGVFLFYGVLFFWGFVSTWVGVPLVLFGAWALVRWYDAPRSAWLLLAALCGAGAVLSHVVLAPAWSVFLLAFVVMGGPYRVALGVGTVSLLPLVPWLWQGVTAATGTTPVLTYESPSLWWHHLTMYVATFDHGAGRGAHVAFLVLVLACIAYGARSGGNAVAAGRTTPEMRPTQRFAFAALANSPALARGPAATAKRRFALAALAGSLALALGLPIATTVGSNEVWGLNFRFLPFAEVCLLALLPTQLPRVSAVALAGALAVYGAALTAFWGRFDATVAPIKTVLGAMEPHRTALVIAAPAPYERAWPRLTTHLGAYYVAAGGAFAQNLFVGGHIPITLRAQPTGRTHGATAELGNDAYLLVQTDTASPASDVQTDTMSPAPAACSTLLLHQGMWSLYGRSEQRAASEGER